MALVVKDRVKVTTATTGTGTLALGSAVAGFQAFSAVLSNTDTTYYAIFESSTGAFEVGLGTYASPANTLARTTVLESSNAGSAINLTAGDADVFITQPAEKAVYLDANGYIFTSDGRNLTNLNATNLTSGTVNDARLPATISSDITGNAATATAWATGRTLSLAGDVTGTSAAFDGSGNITLSTTIAANSVALGTDTTGNYVATGAVSGSGLSGSASSEGATFTVTSNATNANTPSTIVFRDASGNFSAGTITAALTGNASTASTLQTARNIALTGAVTGNANFDGGGNISISTSATSDPTLTLAGDATGSATFTNLGNATLTVTVVDDSHNHIISNVDGLQAALDGKLSTSGKAADSNLLDALDSTQFLRSDVSDTFTSGSLSFSSGTRLTGGLSSPFDGFMMPQNPEGKHIKSPFFFNDIAYARLRGATVSVTVDGTPMTSTTAIDDMLNANGDFWNQTTAGVTTVVITITNIPKPLTYGAYMGITFGNDAWRAKDATLEYSTNNGSTWATAASYADQTEEFLVASFSTGATATNALRWTLQDFNTTSLRVVSLFAYNYNSSGMEGLYVTRDGGDLYANISVNGNTVWNAGNDGSGSGLDADLLDGVQGSSFLRSDTADTATGVVTFTDRIDLHEIRTNTAQELILNAGESASYATGQTGEFVYVNAEDGFQVNASPDNWTSGWAGRVTHTFNASLASFGTTLDIPARIQHTGDTNTYMEFHAADQWRVVTGGVERIEATNSGIRIDDAFTLPTTDGTSGQALVTNGSGTVTWGSAGISTGKAIAMAIVFG